MKKSIWWRSIWWKNKLDWMFKIKNTQWELQQQILEFKENLLEKKRETLNKYVNSIENLDSINSIDKKLIDDKVRWFCNNYGFDIHQRVSDNKYLVKEWESFTIIRYDTDSKDELPIMIDLDKFYNSYERQWNLISFSEWNDISVLYNLSNGKTYYSNDNMRINEVEWMNENKIFSIEENNNNIKLLSTYWDLIYENQDDKTNINDIYPWNNNDLFINKK